MDEIEVESIQDISVEVNDAHTRSSDVEPILHNLETIKSNDDSIIIRHKGEKILRIVSNS